MIQSNEQLVTALCQQVFINGKKDEITYLRQH